jgi:hypothetical protein
MPPTAESADDPNHAHDEADHAEIDDDGSGQRQRRQGRMVQDNDARDDAEDADQERPDPGLGAVDEDPHQLQNADEQQVETQEYGKR